MKPADLRHDRFGSRHENDGCRKRFSSYLGRVAFYGTLCTIFLFSIPYGTVEEWHKATLVAVIAILGCVRLFDGVLSRNFRIAEPLLLLPAVGVLILAVIQLLPLFPDGAKISLDPYETRTFILVFGSLIVCGEVLYTYTNDRYRLKALISVVLLVALSSALFGFFREAIPPAEDGFLASYFSPGQGYAQFINQNHFALMMEMALGLTFGLLLKGEFSEKIRFLGWLLAATFIYSIIASNSRGGMISLAAMFVFGVFVHKVYGSAKVGRDGMEAPAGSRAPSMARTVLAASGLCVLVFGITVFTVAFVGGDAVATRFERIDREVDTLDSSKVNRHLIWTSTVELIKARPVFGSGFGAYEVAFTQHDLSAGKWAVRQAHNDYLEILSNGGIVGLLLFGALGIGVFVRSREILNQWDPFRVASCFGAIVGIFGVLIHSFADFGLHILINALLFVILIVIATVRIEMASEVETAGIAGSRRPGLRKPSSIRGYAI